MTHKQFAIRLARQSGEIMKKYFFTDFRSKQKQDGSPITIADTTINQLVVNNIQKSFPEYGFIGEEGGTTNENAEYVWVCDPLDGTISFVAGIPECVFSLALLKDGNPILGVIYNPFTKRMYFAERGGGAYVNETQIHVSKVKTITRNFVGFVLWNNSYFDASDAFQKLIDLGMNTHGGSSAYLGALVAQGLAVANIFPHTSPWDAAAQKIIVEEAGGKVTDIFGNEQKYNKSTKGLVASNGIVHDQIIKVTSQMRPRHPS